MELLKIISVTSILVFIYILGFFVGIYVTEKKINKKK
jgi:uncharacterized protein YneF (UPF0154 family)